MSWKTAVVALIALVGAAFLLLRGFDRELSRSGLAFGVHPGVVSELELALDDQKRLAKSDPANAAVYRARFAEIQSLLGRLRVVGLSRSEILGSYEQALLGMFGGILLLAVLTHVVARRRLDARLARLQAALGDLSSGSVDVRVAVSGTDAAGRVARMIEETSRTLARSRRRLASLEHLSAWQESARRHAHEMRTPLTAARLELSRLRDGGLDRPELGDLSDSIEQELNRLERFTRAFTAAARLPQPRLEPVDLRAVLEEFNGLFAGAWPNLRLELVSAPSALPVALDREMLRQVLVNLCDNAAQALTGRNGSVRIVSAGTADQVLVDIEDDGPGVPSQLRPRLFQPYATTRKIGEGMGLGLAISRKILLDHGGDLELLRSDGGGSTFRMTLPRREEEPPA